MQVFDLEYLCYISVVLKSLSMPLYLFIFNFSYYLVLFFISSYLFTPCVPVILPIFPPSSIPLLSPLIWKKELVSCYFVVVIIGFVVVLINTIYWTSHHCPKICKLRNAGSLGFENVYRSNLFSTQCQNNLPYSMC